MPLTNKQIAIFFDTLAKLMELHDENPFRIRSYKNAYISIRKLHSPIAEMSPKDIRSISKIGTSIADKILEIIDNQQLEMLQEYQDKTPKGILKLLNIKGIGPKKIKTIWKELSIENPVELLYACNENRLLELKGFGQKTQEDIAQKILFSMQNSDLFLWANEEEEAQILFDFFRKKIAPSHQLSFTGAFRRKDPVLAAIELITDVNIEFLAQAYPRLDRTDATLSGKSKNGFPFKITHCKPEEYGNVLFESTGKADFNQLVYKKIKAVKPTSTEGAIFAQANLPYCPPELRWGQIPTETTIKNIITKKDIKGVIHAHSQWSDGHNSILEMAQEAQNKGYQYLVITDHSKSAFYANGLQVDRVLAQMKEIDSINRKMIDFYVFKGIECDIRHDGNLDYDDDLLEKFDIIIASVHANLRMDKHTSTKRLIKAIEHPKTRILGHLTGRLLLAREGYPIDLDKILDACAKHNVAIELNANPYRLDIDYQNIGKALDRGVRISINPDAHSIQGIDDIQYGVWAARKAGVSAKDNLSSLSFTQFQDFIKNH